MELKLNCSKQGDGEDIKGYPNVQEYKYLGVTVTNSMQLKTEVNNRKGKMKLVWPRLE